MKAVRRLLLPAIAFVPLLFMSCAQNSPLSDVNLDDPSVISLQITLERSLDLGGSATQKIEAIVKDKNSDYVALKNGGITVNGTAMAIAYTALNAPYYTANGLMYFAVNTNYTFVVTLANGKQYNAVVKTQAQDIYSFVAPASAPRAGALNVTWASPDTTGLVSISVTKTVVDSNRTTYAYDNIGVSHPSAGSYTFPAGYFSAKTTTVDLILNSAVHGTVDPSFRAGSVITASISIARRTTLTP
jgi:hypothetical protein